MNPVGWLVMLVFAVGALIRGLLFRRGTHRGLLVLYRSPAQPRMYRNLPLVIPFLGGLMVVLVLGLAPATFSLAIESPLPRQLSEGLAMMFVSLLPFGFGAWTALSYRPPTWLVPDWLRDDDQRIGYVPPGPDWFDHLALLAGLVSAALGIGLVGFGVLRALGAA